MEKKPTPEQQVKHQINLAKYAASQAVKAVQAAAREAEAEVRTTAVSASMKNGNLTKAAVEAARKDRDAARKAAKAACEAAIKAANRAQLDAERAADSLFETKRDELEAQLAESNKPAHAAYEVAKAEIMKEAETEIEKVVRGLNEKLEPLQAELKAVEAAQAEKQAAYAALKAEMAAATAAAAVPPVAAP